MARIIGFDLDQTLYPKSPEIDEAIQRYIYTVIAERKGVGVDEGRRLFLSHYPALSGRKTLLALGISDAEQIIQDALERADIEAYLTPDPAVYSLLVDIKKSYGSISLITGSSSEIAQKKLSKLAIPSSLFSCIITGDVSKSDGSAFLKWMQDFQRRDPTLNPSDFLYIGDRPSTDVDIPLSLGMKAILVNTKRTDSSLDVPQFPRLIDIRHHLLGSDHTNKNLAK